MSLVLTVTTAGRAALINATNTGTAPVTIAQVGLTATALTPAPTDTVLAGEFKRLATLSGGVVADDTIHLTVRDESNQVFTVRSLALYLADGTLFGLYGQAAVLIEKSAQAMMLLDIDVQFPDIDATSITFGDANFLNPPATTEVQGVVELTTLAEAIAGLDASRVPPAKMVKDAVTAWLDARFGAGNSGIWHPGNDGAGSGLDAGLLAGQLPSYYADIPQRLGFTPVQQGTGNGQLTANTIKVGWSGTRLKATVDVSDLGNIAFDSHIADVWRASNDGAGSGLDAGLFAGQLPSYYTDIISRLGYTPARTGTLGNVDFNTAVTGGIYRFDTPTNGPAGLAWGQLLVMRGASDTVTQIASDYSSGVLWTRSGSPAVVGGTGAWGSWKALVSAAAGSTYSAADVLAKLLTVDGSGSGLDADLLDGQNSSWFTDIIARLGFTPANRAGDTFAGAVGFANDGAFCAYKSGSNPVFQFAGGYYISYEVANSRIVVGCGNQGRMYIPLNGNLDFYGTQGFYFNGQLLCHTGNDGSGSGYDADLLDGQHRWQIQSNGDMGANHWWVDTPLANGQTMRETGGSVAIGANTSTIVMLERPLSNIRSLYAQPIRTASGDEGNAYCQREGAYLDRVRVINGLGAAATVEWAVRGAA